MNLKIIRWLVSHREVLLNVVDVAKGYDKNLPALAKWELVDKIARLVIPVLTEEDIATLATFDFEAMDAAEALSLGAEYSALGIDWQLLLKVLVPILQIILDALAKDV